MVRIRALVWSNHSSLLSDLQKAKGQSASEKWAFSFLVPVHVYRLALWAKFSADCILQIWNIFFLFFPEKKIWNFMHNLETICMKCKTCFLENYENFYKMHSAYLIFPWRQFAWNVKTCFTWKNKKKYFKISSTFLIFSKKTRFDISWRQFAWNVKTCFLGKIRNNIIGLLHWYWWILSQVGISSLRASVDIPSRDNIHQYQCDNPFII